MFGRNFHTEKMVPRVSRSVHARFTVIVGLLPVIVGLLPVIVGPVHARFTLAILGCCSPTGQFFPFRGVWHQVLSYNIVVFSLSGEVIFHVYGHGPIHRPIPFFGPLYDEMFISRYIYS